MIKNDEEVIDYLTKNKDKIKVLLDNDCIMVFNRKYEYPIDAPDNDKWTESIDILPEDLLKSALEKLGLEVDYV